MADSLKRPSNHETPPTGGPFAILMLVLWPVMAFATYGSGLLGRNSEPSATASLEERFRLVVSAIDPNTAPWWELTLLTGIGESKAKGIVKAREAAATGSGDPIRPVFRSAADLDRVRGIGPTTVRRIASELRFTSGR